MKNTDIIKDKLNILDVVGSYVKLEKAGKTYKGKSPFTNEKTPSFFVSPEKGFFYCFSSGKGGDMFTFIQDIERIEFQDALKLLAEKAGVTLESNIVSIEKHNQTTLRFKILDDITKWYEVHLRKSPEVVEHLLGRGLTKDTIVKFRLGFALDQWRDCYDYLRSRNYRDDDIESVGLIIKKEGGGYYDRFRSRIMFPLFDGRGRVVGFSGRIFTDDPDIKGAKYINSPEGPLFDKSKVLYGYHTAKNAMSKEDSCILVEGQFDVLMAQQAGYVNTVAISGTGLTDDHITMIKRFTNKVLLALDSDKAGIKATRRSVLAAYRHGMQVQVIMMPDGMDPADTIAHSKEQWDICVTDAKDYIDYRLELVNREEKSFEKKKKLVENDLFTFVYLMKSAIMQDRVLQKIALFLGVSVDAARNDFVAFTPDSDDLIEASVMEPVGTSKDTSNTINPQEDTLYFYSFLRDENHIDSFKNFKRIQELYSEYYGGELDDDYQALDETKKNIQLFVMKETYHDSSSSIFEKELLTKIIDPYIASLKQKKHSLIEQGRVAESKQDNARFGEIQKESMNINILIEQLIAERDN